MSGIKGYGYKVLGVLALGYFGVGGIHGSFLGSE